MQIIRADYIIRCDEAFEILRDKAICFDSKIIEIAEAEVLKKRYPHASYHDSGANSLLMPGLINTHVHLEFSANTTALKYGDFIPWLQSVIAQRDALQNKCAKECIDEALSSIMISGTTTIGAISSFGADLEACVKSPLNVIYFTEVLGSNPQAVDTLYEDFVCRLAESRGYESSRFIPAISVHSPYSTHYVLARRVLKDAKDFEMLVSTHFMESQAERDWLDHGEGDFKAFFAPFAPDAKPVNDAMEYLALFKGVKTLFTHATKATDAELKKMQEIGSITHCPRSNRLLGNGRLAVEKLQSFTLGTDGMSSNDSLNLWDEMRAALMLHHHAPLTLFAKKLLLSATREGAKALGLEKGVLEEGKDADIIMITLPDEVEDDESLALALVMFTKEADRVYIAGERLECYER
jgi:cytosine/adenosine deaminase-related metal-dependent hydrolase